MSKLAISLNGQTVEVELDWLPLDGNRVTAEVDGRQMPIIFSADGGPAGEEIDWLIVDGRPLELVFGPCLRWVETGGIQYALEIRDLDAVESWSCPGDSRIKAPIPGLITTILVQEGSPVRTGQPLLILEAMKMENEIRSPQSGIVESLHVAPGQTVTKGELLVTIDDEAD